MTGILDRLGIDPFYLFIIIFVLLIVLIVLYIMLYVNYRKIRKSYRVFMEGKNGQDLEKAFLRRFEKLERVRRISDKNRQDIRALEESTHKNIQKTAIVKYDAFHEMGGNLSFVLTMLDAENNGWILNAMHSRDGCYTYIKEVEDGRTDLELSDEEKQCLEKAVQNGEE